MRLKAAIFFLFLATTSRAEWRAVSAESEYSSDRRVEHRYLVAEDSATGDRASLELALFSTKSCTLRVFDQPNEPRGDLEQVMRRENCLAGVNGGYFDPDYQPIGLLIVDGKIIAPLQKARLLSGVLLASARGIQILRVREFSPKLNASAAIECGPFLIDGGRRVTGLEASRGARRTFAAVASGGRAALGFCSDVALADLANILATVTVAGDFKMQRALNLDGGSSSAFWFKRANGRAFSISERKTVRDFVAVVPR